jgi:hypothetical protein
VTVSGALRVVIATPSQGALLESATEGVWVEGLATTWSEARDGPRPVDFDPGVREVWLHVNGAAPIPTTLVAGRFQGRIPLSDGDNRVVAVATTLDGRTAQDEVTVRLRAPGCAELSVAALHGDRPTLSLSDRAIEFVFDASNSMWGRMDGEPKISVAKRILSDALDWLPEDLALSLRVYGHQHAHAKRHCQDSALLVALGPDSRAQIRDAIDHFKPRGQTPLAYSLQQIAADFGDFQGERAVVLVTDGIESCDGDPAAAARALQRSGPTPVHVIGFGIASGEDEDDSALRAIARASGGKFLTARSADELRDALAVTVGTPYAVRSTGRVVAEGTLGIDDPIRLPAGDYTLRIESRPPYEVPIRLESEQGLKLLLKRDGRKVFHARSSEAIDYARCELPVEPERVENGVVWEELPDAAGPASGIR